MTRRIKAADDVHEIAEAGCRHLAPEVGDAGRSTQRPTGMPATGSGLAMCVREVVRPSRDEIVGPPEEPAAPLR